MAKELTDRQVANAAPPRGGGQKDVYDTIGGFALRVSGKSKSDCTKTWVGMWRLNGKPTRFNLGSYPSLGVKAARERAIDWKSKVRAGVDPRPENRPAEKPQVETFGDLAQLYLDKKLPTLAPRNAEDVRSVIERRLLPAWRTWHLQDFDGTEPADLCDPLVEQGKPGAARATMEAAKAVWNFGAKRKVKGLPPSPFRGLETPAKKVSRDRVLDDDEIRAVWDAAATAGYPAGPLVQLLLLLGLRRGELAEAVWSEIDLEKAEFTVPAGRSKNNETMVVPLPESAVAILKELPHFSAGDFVFSTTAGRRPISGFTKMRERLSRLAQDEYERILKEQRRDLRDMDRWTYHDLRRSCATKLAELNTPVHIVEKILNHTTGELGGVAEIYNRYKYFKERRHWLEVWARHLDELVQGEREKVVTFPA